MSDLKSVLQNFFEAYSKALSTELQWKVKAEDELMPGEAIGIFTQNKRTSLSGRPLLGRYTPYQYTYDLVHTRCLNGTTEDKLNGLIHVEIEGLHQAVHKARSLCVPNTTMLQIESAQLNPDVEVIKYHRRLDREESGRFWVATFVTGVNFKAHVFTEANLTHTLR